MPQKKRILFLCTGNACRSQMAEALLRKLGGADFEALSAGSRPAGFIHDLAIKAMNKLEIPVDGQESKSWDEFANARLDAVVTLCDSAASETCPVWPGDPLTAHWSTPDPTHLADTEEERLKFAVCIATRLRTKIRGLVDMDWSRDDDEIKKHLEFLGDI